ncbi:MAG: M16 family metallopeptidase, partial [Pirellula sp.]
GAMYHVPAGGNPEYAAVDLLASILTDQPSGRLYKSLIETKKATQVFGGSFALHDPGVITFMAQVPKDKSAEEARLAMLDTLENLASNPITTEELERARRQALNNREMAASKSDSIAISLSDWAAQGDWRLYFLFRDAIEKATVEQVQLAA